MAIREAARSAIQAHAAQLLTSMLAMRTAAGRLPTRASTHTASRRATACLVNAAAIAKPPSSSMIVCAHHRGGRVTLGHIPIEPHAQQSLHSNSQRPKVSATCTRPCGGMDLLPLTLQIMKVLCNLVVKHHSSLAANCCYLRLPTGLPTGVHPGRPLVSPTCMEVTVRLGATTACTHAGSWAQRSVLGLLVVLDGLLGLPPVLPVL